MDEITQWEIVASVERISEAYLMPVLETMLLQFPFITSGFHSDNGSVVRKQLGYAYIPQRCAGLINEFNREFFNPYINFHRPCFFPVSVIDPKGKIRKTYPYEEVRTPYERLKSLPQAESYLRPGVTLEKLETIANQMSDNQFAERMVNARSNLFQPFLRRANRVA